MSLARIIPTRKGWWVINPQGWMERYFEDRSAAEFYATTLYGDVIVENNGQTDWAYADHRYPKP